MKITKFQDLDYWQESTSLAIDIYKLTSEGGIASDFGLRDQIRRSAVTIASNIAEGKERETVAELIRFLYIAKGPTSELRTQLYIANRVGYLSDIEYQKLSGRVEHLSRMIANLIKALKRSR